ncbi:transposase [Xanthomonas campestris]|uniref:transposase n=1 Tax=Xanthomonas campestris TaxID=339 RepID=UPI0028684D0A|nr:transposase [Xanthomonas campestris]
MLCLLGDGDRLRYLHLLHEALEATGCKLLAYVLIDNHVHLLITPPAAGRIGQLMQRLGRCYVALFNGRHGRTGTLWDGRYKACLVDSANYVLCCYSYIELNPVRARLIDDPASYRWSRCPANLGQRGHSALTPHPCWLALGNDPIQRSNAYRAMLHEALPDELLTSIRLHLQQQRALGHDAFRAMVEAKARRFAGARPALRPRKPSAVG